MWREQGKGDGDVEGGEIELRACIIKRYIAKDGPVSVMVSDTLGYLGLLY